MKIQSWQLRQRQSLALPEKVHFSLLRIEEWYNYYQGNVYVSFSGGKDSTVLLHLVRSLYPEVPAVFVDTGCEYPEVRAFVKTIKNVTWLKPKMSFKQVIVKYGYPVVSKENAQKLYEIRTGKSEKLKQKRLYGDKNSNGKLAAKWHFLIDAPFKISHHCCNVLKKNPVKIYENKTGNKGFIGTMAEDSRNRVTAYLQTGCNNFQSKRSISKPLSIWGGEDIWEYIKTNDLSISSIYQKGYRNTGCMYCCFGSLENNKFELLKVSHPACYKYGMEKLNLKSVLNYVYRGELNNG